MRHIKLLKTLAQHCGLPLSQTTYWGRTAKEIRSRHWASLARIDLAAASDKHALLIYHDEYRVVPELLGENTGQAWCLLGENDHGTGVFSVGTIGGPCVLVDRLFAPDLCKRLDFFDGAHTVFSVDSTDFYRLVKPHPCELARREHPPSYRAKLARVAPISAAGSLKDRKDCILGISIENENFERPERLAATIEWIDGMFDRCLVVIGDSIHRLTLQIRNPGLSEDEALKRAIELGGRFNELNWPLFEVYGRRCRFMPLAMSDPAYRDLHQEGVRDLQSFYDASEPYRRVVGTFARDFGHRQVLGDRIVSQDRLGLASRYLIEEAAFCGLLVALEGFRVLVYPGEIKPFQELAEGKIPDAPEPLRKLELVSLDLERQWLPGEKPPRVKGAA